MILAFGLLIFAQGAVPESKPRHEPDTDLVIIDLPMDAHVRGTEVELGEIAKVQGADQELVARVAAVELGYAPAPGYSRLFFAEHILQTAQRQLPTADLRFAGQRACRVYPEVDSISGLSILEAAREALVETQAGRDVSFEATGQLPPVDVPAGSGEPVVRARLEAPVKHSGLVTVPVEVHVDGVRYRTVWTTWKVELWETRPVLARAVRAGEPLATGDFRRQRRRVESSTEAGLLDAEHLSGAVAARDLMPGNLVTDRDVHRPTVVSMGESVFLRVKKGSIEARVSAVALEPGAVGDRVRVRAADSNQTLLATVRSADYCEIDLGQ